MANIRHWALCKKYGLIHKEKWYGHWTETAIKKEKMKRSSCQVPAHCEIPLKLMSYFWVLSSPTPHLLGVFTLRHHILIVGFSLSCNALNLYHVYSYSQCRFILYIRVIKLSKDRNLWKFGVVLYVFCSVLNTVHTKASYLLILNSSFSFLLFSSVSYYSLCIILLPILTAL